jgi:hypothetical protein
VQQHIHQHIRDFIAIDVGIREGQWVDLTNRWRFLPSNSGMHQELYVDPSSGLVRLNKDYHYWRQSAAKRRPLRRSIPGSLATLVPKPD